MMNKSKTNFLFLLFSLLTLSQSFSQEDTLFREECDWANVSTNLSQEKYVRFVALIEDNIWNMNPSVRSSYWNCLDHVYSILISLDQQNRFWVQQRSEVRGWLGNYTGQIEDIQTLLAMDSCDICYFNSDQYDSLNTGILWSTEPKYMNRFEDIGDVYYNMIEDYPSAMKFYQQALDYYKNYFESKKKKKLTALYLLTEKIAQTYEKQAQYPDAVKHYTKAISIFEEYLENWKNKDDSELFDEAKEPEKYEIEWTTGRLYFDRAMCKRMLKDYRGTIRDLESIRPIVESQSDSLLSLFGGRQLPISHVYFYLGQSYSILKDTEKALIFFNHCIDIDSEDDQSYFQRGFVYYDLNQIDKACQDWSIAGELGITDAYELIQKYCND